MMMKLYRLTEARGALVTWRQLADHNQDCGIDDFDEEQIQEFLK